MWTGVEEEEEEEGNGEGKWEVDSRSPQAFASSTGNAIGPHESAPWPDEELDPLYGTESSAQVRRIRSRWSLTVTQMAITTTQQQRLGNM